MNQASIHRNTLRGAPRWVHGLAWGAFGVITLILLVLFLFYRDTDVWLLWMGNEPKTSHAFNEAVHSSIFRTPANTWSNLAYVLVGLYVVAYAWWDARRKTTEQDPYAVRQPALMGLYGVACIVVGFGSGAMHASMMSWGHKADVFGMFFTFVALIALQWARWVPFVPFTGRRWPTWPFFGIIAIVASVLLLLYGKKLGGDMAVLGTLTRLIALGLVVDVFWRRTSQQFRWVALAFVSLLVAGYIWRLDKTGQFTAPDAWLQGHAIWHVLTAVMYGSMAYFYRSEVPRHSQSESVTAIPRIT